MSDRPFVLIKGGPPASTQPSTGIRPDVGAHIVDWIFSEVEEHSSTTAAHVIIARFRSLLALVHSLQLDVAALIASNVSDETEPDRLLKLLLKQRDAIMNRFSDPSG